MLQNIGIWATPLLLLPGVALLIMSTSIRYGQIHSEFHQAEHHSEALSALNVQRLLRRANLFRNALVSLYASFGLFSLASLIGGLANAWMQSAEALVMTLSCAGIAGLVFAAATLVRETLLSLDIIRSHFVTLAKEKSGVQDAT